MEVELWKHCVKWMTDVGVLTKQQKAAQSNAQIFDLAQTLRDGVVLCNLLNILKPHSVNPQQINTRPQMLQVCKFIVHQLEVLNILLHHTLVINVHFMNKFTLLLIPE